MIVASLFFYLFASICVASAFMVIAARNPVHSVLFLIVVYVGAVAVLFLFVVMMLDVDFAELGQGFLDYLPVGAPLGIVFLIELLLVVGARTIGGQAATITAPIPPIASESNTEALGEILYTRYIYYFQAAGVVLLIAMIGAIVL